MSSYRVKRLVQNHTYKLVELSVLTLIDNIIFNSRITHRVGLAIFASSSWIENTFLSNLPGKRPNGILKCNFL